MACDPGELRHVPLFELLDNEEAAVLAAQVELKRFAPRQRIYKIGDPGKQAYVMMEGSVRVTTVDEDHQEVVVDQPGHGDFFGFASMLEQTKSPCPGWSTTTNRGTAISLASPPCLSKRPTRPTPLPWKKPYVWRWIATTSPFCCNANPWPAWIC